MKTKLLTIMILLFMTSCERTKNSKSTEKKTIEIKRNKIFEITNSDYYNFFNDVLDNRFIIEKEYIKFPDLTHKNEYWKEILIPLTEKNSNEKLSNILTNQDIENIFTQHSQNLRFDLDFNQLKIDKVSKKVHKLVSNSLEKGFTLKDKYDYKGIYYLNLPFFSTDKKYAILEYGYYCGPENGFDGIEVYEFKNGKWIEIGSIGTIIMS